MGRKLIPTTDSAFVEKARSFAQAISEDPQRFGLTRADAEAMTQAAARFNETFLESKYAGRSTQATRAKNEAREEVKRLFNRCINIIRLSESVDARARLAAGIHERPERLRARKRPMELPELHFMKALHHTGASPMHELIFLQHAGGAMAKPEGAVRLELFVDLVPPDEPIPARPGANLGGRPWYLRSYTRSPIRVAPPMARVPMRVVYWGRWADSTGNVGPFSATAAAWIEGGSHHALPGGWTGSQKPTPVIEDAAASGPRKRDPSYTIAVLDVQYELLNGPEMAPDGANALPAPQDSERRQLEGPDAASEAA